MRANERVVRAADRVRHAALSSTCRHEIVWRWEHIWAEGDEMSRPVLLDGRCERCGDYISPCDLERRGITAPDPEPVSFEDYWRLHDAVHHTLASL